MTRLTDDMWKAARREWETNPSVTLKDIADIHGVDKASVGRRASKEGWQKQQRLGDINQAAQRKADRQVDSRGNTKLENPQDHTFEPFNLEESEDLRAEVLARHRNEWAELEACREAARQAMLTANSKPVQDIAEWKLAKLAVDTAAANLKALEIKQSGEIRAWGLDYLTDLSSLTDEQLAALIKG